MRSSILRITVGVTALVGALSLGTFHQTRKVQAFVGGGCMIGDDTGDIWVNMYQETPQGGKGKQIWNGTRCSINTTSLPL
jgi:hypothetical protein